MLAFLSNLGPTEIVVVALVAILVFGKNLPEAASKAFVQLRKLRNAIDDLKRDTGIEKELRDIQRTVREAEWEARRSSPPASLPRTTSVTTSVTAAAPVAPVEPEAEAESEAASEENTEKPPDEPPPDPLAERRASWRP